MFLFLCCGFQCVAVCHCLCWRPLESKTCLETVSFILWINLNTCLEPDSWQSQILPRKWWRQPPYPKRAKTRQRLQNVTRNKVCFYLCNCSLISPTIKRLLILKGWKKVYLHTDQHNTAAEGTTSEGSLFSAGLLFVRSFLMKFLMCPAWHGHTTRPNQSAALYPWFAPNTRQV